MKNEVFSAALCYARYNRDTEKLTGLGMKTNLFSPSLANKDFNSLRDENDEPIYTYNDEYMRRFVRQSIKG